MTARLTNVIFGSVELNAQNFVRIQLESSEYPLALRDRRQVDFSGCGCADGSQAAASPPLRAAASLPLH